MILYKSDETPSLEEVIALYNKAGLRRPDDERRMNLMLKHANVKISAWHNGKLVGFLRAFTDYCFDCYLNDLAVDPEYQGRGIGKAMVAHLKEQLEKDTLVFLISAPESKPFYKKIGFSHFTDIEDTWRQMIE
ncbi:GNAT family N-acetyltransferase [Paenibacillus ginsengarvi]|uniref:N-acetyltransferase n=1 Tax=Paenibacillus ginsengarvi TaxID=400777 RepID=A0A3B0BUD9_9BACL|nr:GNAT family N-acetyltransferase [Paenibacillus ginsengarvi]RKN75884.1 N-acetyltransferase [Paenibacillus ginsengarvi]